jgi:hypothetical protein
VPTLKAESLQLDPDSLDTTALSVATLERELSLAQRPNALLRKMMDVFESKRQAKGLGWSRAWNKYDLNVFRSHKASLREDSAYLRGIRPLVDDLLAAVDVPTAQAQFVQELLQDPNTILYTFYHNRDVGAVQWEGLTLSFGRTVASDKSKCDRVDILLEDARVNGAVDGRVDCVRFYVCPWKTYVDKQFELHEHTSPAGDLAESAQAAYEHAIRFYDSWKNNEDRQWNHWSTRYISYFGARQFIPQGSSFL